MKIRSLVYLFIFLICAPLSATVQERAWPEIFKDVKEKVVQIFAFEHDFDWKEPYKRGNIVQGRGTGFFNSKEGDIYTNFHVVDGSMVTFIQVPALGKEKFEVTFMGGSPDYDWAHLKLKPEELDRMKAALSQLKQQGLIESDEIQYLELGDSDGLSQGSEIMLIGYPLGEENVTSSIGTISGQQSNELGECFTTNAPTNPGSSGGPVIDKSGKVVGILVGQIRQAQGMNFVIPISRLKVILEEFKDGKIVESPYWGFRTVPTTPSTLEYLGTEADAGVYVAHVKKNSLAEKAGLCKGDIITHINSFKVDRFGYVRVSWTKYQVDLEDVLARIKNGSQVTFSVYRSGQTIACSVQADFENYFKIKKHYPPFQEVPPFIVFGGMVIMELTLNHLEMMLPMVENLMHNRIYLDTFKFFSPDNMQASRLFITHIYPETELAKNRVFNGLDRFISKVNSKEVGTIKEFEQAVLDHAKTGYMNLETDRGAFIASKLDEIATQEPFLSDRYGYEISSLVEKIGG